MLELTDHLQESGRHITGDNFFTSINLVRALLGRQMTYSGTIRKNKGEIPTDVLNFQICLDSNVTSLLFHTYPKKVRQSSYSPHCTMTTN